jgi:hypothetical protein
MPELSDLRSCSALPQGAVLPLQFREESLGDAIALSVSVSDLPNVLMGEIEAPGDRSHHASGARSGGELRLERYKIHGEYQPRLVDSDLKTAFINQSRGKVRVGAR